MYNYYGEIMKDLHKNKTKILLSNALKELLQEKPFENIKLIEICDRALVHKTTFYNHFEDKYDLLNYIIRDIQKTMLKKVEDNDDIIKYYLDIAKEYITNIKENAYFYKALLISNQNGICSNIIHNIFVRDVIQNTKKHNINIPPNYVANYYVSGLFSVVSEWVMTDMKESEEDMISYIEKLITNKIMVN